MNLFREKLGRRQDMLGRCAPFDVKKSRLIHGRLLIYFDLYIGRRFCAKKWDICHQCLVSLNNYLNGVSIDYRSINFANRYHQCFVLASIPTLNIFKKCWAFVMTSTCQISMRIDPFTTQLLALTQALWNFSFQGMKNEMLLPTHSI